MLGGAGFPRMRTYVAKHIEACVECAFNKRQGGAPEAQLHVSETVPIPFKTVHVDHLGSFIKTTRGNAIVIAIVDAFSRYVVVEAVRSTDTKAVIIMFRELVQYFETPVSDRGTAYTSKNFAYYCNDHSIQHIKNTVRTPRANGQVERVNALITTFLRTTHTDVRKYDVDLWHFQWAINSQVKPLFAAQTTLSLGSNSTTAWTANFSSPSTTPTTPPNHRRRWRMSPRTSTL